MTYKPNDLFFNLPSTRDYNRDLNERATQIWLTFPLKMLLNSTEIAATVKTHTGNIFLLVKLRTTETSKQTNILLLGSFQSPSSMAILLCVFLCRDCVMCVLQADWGYRRTWQVNTDARRCWHRVTSKTTAKVPWHFLDFYCHSFGPRPAVLPLLIVMMWAYF